jgi:hypothetical protein
MRNMNCIRKSEFDPRTASLFLLVLAALLTLGLPAARAQQDDEQKGVDQGNYNIKQSIEFGGRFTSVGGDFQSYDTFVNLQQGPRLLGFTMEMRSLNHHEMFFDRLYFSNFGYGGDPNMTSRLRISKNKWYNFDALFRKDQNFWDYSLQANPLNPTAPFANGPAGYAAPTCTSCVLAESPHLMNTRRKLGDYSLLLLPESRVRLRLGYSRNIVEGPVFTTIHQGTEQALFEDYKTTVNSYRIGVDFKLLPRTNISYDQIWNFYKGDTGTTDLNQNSLFQLSNGTPVDLGVSFNSGASQPCGGTFLATGFVNPNCSAYLTYLNHGRTRTSTPTEQLSLQSNYWKDWDFSARATYSGGDMNVFDYNQTFFGRESRTNLSNDQITGPVQGRHVAATADFGATWHITAKLNFIDSFHFGNWHNPAQFLSSECSFFSPNLLTSANFFAPTATVPVNCAAPSGTVAGTPAHSASSGPDITVLLNSNFLKQDEKTNLAELEYQFNPKFGARLGYRFRHRAIADNFYNTADEIFFPNNAARGVCALTGGLLPAGCTQNADGSISFVVPPSTPNPPGLTFISEHAALFGFWARPTANWRISFDTELMSADTAFTRISPRESQEYRLRTKYKVSERLSLNGNINIWEGRNNVFQVNDLQHSRAYGLSAIFQPVDKIGLEIGYDYSDVFSQILICYISVAAGQNGPGIQACPDVPGLVQQLSTYINNSHYGYFNFTLTPIPRLTARVGADLTGTSGSQLRLDPQALIPNQVTGPLNSKWLHPFGGLDYHIAKGWTGRFYWDYYGYHEDPTAGAVQDIYAPRNFRANLITLSIRYAF